MPTSIDPREQSESFRNLQPGVQRIVRQGWTETAEQDARVAERSKALRRRSIVEALVLVGGTEVWLKGFAPLHSAVGIVLAVAIGEAWWRTDAGQLATPLIAAVPYLILQLIWLQLGIGQYSGVLFGASFIAFSTAYLGLRREQRVME